jgi:hypothetical protein
MGGGRIEDCVEDLCMTVLPRWDSCSIHTATRILTLGGTT